MVHYKLTYFNFTGLAEHIRQLFVLAGQEFDDVRYTMDEWQTNINHTSATGFGKIPVLEEDGKVLAQSNAIARYLARKFGYAGKTAWEQAEVDSLADQFMDFIKEALPFIQATAGYPNTPDPATLVEPVFVPAVKKHFPLFEKFLKNNGSGFFVGNSLTWFDLEMAEFTFIFSSRLPHLYEDLPLLLKHAEKIHSIPVIKKWREEQRPKSDL